MAKTYGYCRCSTNETKQDMMRQRRELTAHGVQEQNIFEDWEHGDAVKKEQLDILKETLAEGDTLVTTEVSRISRSTQQLCEFIDFVQKKHVRLVLVTSITIDCRNGEIDPMSKAFLQMASVFSELELSMIRDRVRSGMANAKAKGKQIGRKKVTADDIPAEFVSKYTKQKRDAKRGKRMNVSKLAEECNVSRQTAYRYIKMLEGDA